MSVGIIVYEDDYYRLIDFTDNYHVEFLLLLKKEQRSARIYMFLYDDKNVHIRLELTGREWYQEVNYTVILPASVYLDLWKELTNISNPRDFARIFIKLMSPQLYEALNKDFTNNSKPENKYAEG